MPKSRTFNRYAVSLSVTLQIGDTTRNTEIKDLSLGGASIFAPAGLPVGARVRVSFRVPTHGHAIEVGGWIRWSDDLGCGIQFDGLRAVDVWTLNQYFGQLTQTESELK